MKDLKLTPITVKRTHKTVLTSEKPFGKACAHYLFAERDTVVRGYDSKEVSSGIMVNSDDKNTIFCISKEFPSVDNNMIEIESKLIGLDQIISSTITNHSERDIKFKKDDVIGEISALEFVSEAWEKVDKLDSTTRNDKGYGSTGF
ncbi:hypothetical protein A0H76_2034 [Hepatospora eriocheir]|uniref:Uncharacterized protein n=1 Tax=Hepatospora eriocheir TaxID=1081669 RepID=A0A1X0QK80_9MICR|nr:hypothetical protein A0H76_2034 [Hepatospora eriocheir]